MSTSSSRSWLARGAWGFGLAFFAAAFVVAFGVVQLYIQLAQGAFGGAAWWLAWGGTIGLLAVAAGLMRRPVHGGGGWALASGFAAVLATRGAACWWLDGPMVSDFQEYHDLAVAAAAGGPWFSDLRPMGYPLLKAAGFALVGPVHWWGEAINVACALATAGFLFLWVRRLWGALAGTFAVWIFALLPAQALMAAVQGTEIPYGMLFMAALWAFAALPAPWAGAVLGLSQYVRPTSLLLLPAVAVGYALAGRWRAIVPYVGGLLVVLAPVAAWNWQTHHTVSLSTSTYGGWSLLVGSNQRSNGFWNQEDTELVAKVPPGERDAFARAEARKRVLTDPVGFAGLAVRKFGFLWGAEDYGAYWTLGVKPHGDGRPAALLYLLSQLAYSLVLALAWWGLWQERRQPAEPVVLALLGLASLVGAHTFLEVQSRYHFYWTPVFAGLAGVGALRAWQALSRPPGSRPGPVPAPATSPGPGPGPTP